MTFAPTDNRKDVYGIVKSVAIVVDVLVKNKCSNQLINEVIDKFNNGIIPFSIVT